MNLIANPTTIVVHGEYTMLWVFFFGGFCWFWAWMLNTKLGLIGRFLEQQKEIAVIESLGGKLIKVGDGRAVFKMVSPPHADSQPPVGTKGGADSKEG